MKYEIDVWTYAFFCFCFSTQSAGALRWGCRGLHRRGWCRQCRNSDRGCNLRRWTRRGRKRGCFYDRPQLLTTVRFSSGHTPSANDQMFNYKLHFNSLLVNDGRWWIISIITWRIWSNVSSEFIFEWIWWSLNDLVYFSARVQVWLPVRQWSMSTGSTRWISSTWWISSSWWTSHRYEPSVLTQTSVSLHSGLSSNWPIKHSSKSACICQSHV